MPRFVVLEHDHPQRHWDLMLETGESLRTWRLPLPPSSGVMVATASFDHRLMYLDYEGPISGGRGCVVRWDRGSFDWQIQSPDRIVIHLHGERLRGVLQLERGGGDDWRGELRVDACEG